MIRSETQREILELVRNKDADTVASIGERLGITETAVRRHLDGLQAGGFVVRSAVRDGAGRPRHEYSLTEAGHAALPKQYQTLLMALLTEIRGLSAEQTTGLDGNGLLEKLIRQVADRSGRPGADTAPDDRVQALHGILDGLDFAPQIEETETGVTVSLRNCPFREVALNDPAVCEFDRSLIGSLLAVVPEKACGIADGDPCCVYSVDTSVATA